MSSVERKLIKGYQGIPFLVFYIYMLFRFAGTTLQPGDDYIFQTADITYGSLTEAMKVMYLQWGGRILILAIANWVFKLPLPILWVILAGLFTLLVFYMVHLTTVLLDEKRDLAFFLISSIAIILMMVMSPVLFHASVLWYTGYFFYPLPLLGFFMGIFPFLAEANGKETNQTDKFFSFLGVSVCAYMEQTAVLFAVTATVCMGLLLYRKKTQPVLWIVYLWGIFNAVIEFCAPGNWQRNIAEQIKWYPGFDMLGNEEKIVSGLFHTTYTLFQNDYTIVLFLLVILLLLGYRKGRASLLWSFLLLTGGFFVKKIVLNLPDDIAWRLFDLKIFTTCACLIFWILLLIFTIFEYMERSLPAVIVSLLLLAAVLEGVLMGFSSTLYESGVRIVFFSYMLLAQVICFLGAFLIKNAAASNF